MSEKVRISTSLKPATARGTVTPGNELAPAESATRTATIEVPDPCDEDGPDSDQEVPGLRKLDSTLRTNAGRRNRADMITKYPTIKSVAFNT